MKKERSGTHARGDKVHWFLFCPRNTKRTERAFYRKKILIFCQFEKKEKKITEEYNLKKKKEKRIAIKRGVKKNKNQVDSK